ncbi:hypothetical protein H311_04907, partial [Anncaliia algerae PRA109]
MNYSSPDLIESLYDKYVSGELPENWEILAKEIIDFCTDEDVSSVRKFKEELWSQYIVRLRDWSKINGCSGQKVIKHIRTQWLPRDLRIVFFNTEMTLYSALEKVKEWEYFINSQKLITKR